MAMATINTTLSVETIQQAASTYFSKVDAAVKQYGLPAHQPAAVGWKVADINEFNDALSGFLKSGLVAQCHIGFVDNRYIASIVFKEPIYQNIRILKLMQRRPGSTDPIGLDHADFPVEDLAAAEATLAKQKVPKWGHESNDVHGWISVWFDGLEVKYFDHIVLDIAVKELQDTISQLGFEPKPLE